MSENPTTSDPGGAPAPLLGFDLEDPQRVAERLEKRSGLAERLFTPGERAYAAAQAEPARHLTARFCAKEATVKALGLDPFEPHDIEVVGGGADARLVLHGEARQRAEALGVEVRVSMSHGRGFSGAVAVALPRGAWAT